MEHKIKNVSQRGILILLIFGKDTLLVAPVGNFLKQGQTTTPGITIPNLCGKCVGYLTCPGIQYGEMRKRGLRVLS